MTFHEIDRTTRIVNNSRKTMGPFKGNFLGIFQLAFLAGLMLFCGCATTETNSLFTVSGPAWHIRQGQALWTPKSGAPQIGGDLILATDVTGRSFVQFDKTPMTIVTVQTTPDRWLLHFPQAGLWKGHKPAPTRTIWLYLSDAIAGKPLPKPLHYEQKPDGNWRLENTKTGEILEGFFSS